jgi:hypothetical protein
LSPAELLDALACRGFTFEVRGERLHVDPTPDARTLDELRAAKVVLLSYIAEHGGRWPIPPASAHRYVVRRGLLDFTADNYGVCIACGCPWEMHGRPAFETWNVVDDPDSVELIRAQPIVEARAIVAAEVASHLGGLSASGRLCVRCARIARVFPDGVCTFCVAAHG